MAPDPDPVVAAEIALRQAYVDGAVTVAQGSIDRIRAGATGVVTAASAIATVYGAVLGVTFAATGGTTLPPRGLIAPVFFGLAIVFATAYLAVPSAAEITVEPPSISDDLDTSAESVVNQFVRLNSTAALVNRERLVAAVLALAFGTVFLPAAFITFATKPAGSATANSTAPSGGSKTSGGTTTPGGTTTSGGTKTSEGTKTSGGTTTPGGTKTSEGTKTSGGTTTSGGTKTPGRSDPSATKAREWPNPRRSLRGVSDPQLRRILYTAQVAEVARQRKAADSLAVPREGHDVRWAIGGAFLALLVLAIGFGVGTSAKQAVHTGGIVVPLFKRP